MPAAKIGHQYKWTLLLAMLVSLKTWCQGIPSPELPTLKPAQVAAAEKLSPSTPLNNPLWKSAYALDVELVRSNFDGDILDATTVPLVEREWMFLDRWLVQQSSGRSQVNGRMLQQLIGALDPNVSVSTLDLQSTATLVSIDQSGIGHLIIVTGGRGASAARRRLDISPFAADSSDAQLNCWKLASGVRPCAAQVIGSLPSDSRGRQRFYIEARYAQSMGGTQGHQLSVWLWDGRAATALYITSFATVGGATGQGVRVDGDSIRIGSKNAKSYRMLFACGACDGRQVERRLMLTADNQVEDLGTTSLTPQLDLIDAIFSRFSEDRDATGLASAAALRAMRQFWSLARGRGDRPLFLNEAETVIQENGGTQLCFLANSSRGDRMPPMRITFAGSDTHLRVVSAVEMLHDTHRRCDAVRAEKSAE